MRHTIKSDDPRAGEMTQAIDNCVHCGFCLPACPTYNILEQEMDSPRGRIYLMKSVLEEKISAEDAQPHIDRCLGCMACITACPSGVAYGDLLLGYRAQIEKTRTRPMMDSITRKMVVETLPYPGRFRAAASDGQNRQDDEAIFAGKSGDNAGFIAGKASSEKAIACCASGKG